LVDGNGGAALYNLMEDAATAEISRTQVWQWLKNKAKLDDERTLTPNMIMIWEEDELEKIKKYVGENVLKMANSIWLQNFLMN
jgi:malate synthase